ncbi:helix-turn-helix domain-containing protein [Lactobacillus sp. LC28-10]|uniref:HTH cro/C1-type domain-containing protein n=2 Tax=Secundilactobacillus TaxID=2767892 RepID=A0A1Z5IWB1_9LACO|nr:MULTISPECIES: helix-turn-helix domain-containing protein [Secundilactobacillus]MCH5462955.1 helix-turn-helix domain-containing protein [Secundilactobacillus angelensis]NLR18680.1 helix-turn-helix domain-containing protein [Secundilactobacillus angelensis]GAX06080.1 hypothetical protein IWT25_01405 [Secundilactobacillus pentosiphilus]
MGTLAEQLRTTRISRGYSQNEIATMLHITRQSVSKWETGRAYPDIDNLIYLSDIYGLSIDKLLKKNQDLENKIQTNQTVINDKKKQLKQINKSLYSNRDEGILLLVLTLISGIIPPIGVLLPIYVMWRNTKYNALFKTIYAIALVVIIVSVINTSIYAADNWFKPSQTTVYKIN